MNVREQNFKIMGKYGFLYLYIYFSTEPNKMT